MSLDQSRDARSCPFCTRPNVLHANTLAFSCWDIAPASPGHLLVIPVRHETNFLGITREEREAMWQLLQTGRNLIEQQYQPDGYNLGVNLGEAAGQTIAHVHLHLIPRYWGDVENPRGGVRAVIPGRRAEPG
jgi:diadenosine tetraphosphate (Ap4A) HIT family hydrolase